MQAFLLGNPLLATMLGWITLWVIISVPAYFFIKGASRGCDQ